MLPEIFARFELVIYILAATLIASIYFAIRKRKLNQLIKHKQMTNAKVFRFGAETSMAISDEGLIGMVNFRLHTLTVDIRKLRNLKFF